MKYLFVIVFIIVFILFDKSIGYTDTSPVWTHFTYMFQHAGIIHLTLNSLAFIGMFRVLEKIINKYILSATILSIGVAASFISTYQLPTVGISGAVYAMIGIYLSMITTKKLIIKDKSKFIIFVLSVLICLVISFFKTNSNFQLHIFSLMIGYVYWYAVYLWNIINKI